MNLLTLPELKNWKLVINPLNQPKCTVFDSSKVYFSEEFWRIYYSQGQCQGQSKTVCHSIDDDKYTNREVWFQEYIDFVNIFQNKLLNPFNSHWPVNIQK